MRLALGSDERWLAKGVTLTIFAHYTRLLAESLHGTALQGSHMIGFDLLVGHLVGDYILQNDWQALNKKQRSLPCLVHCLLYTFAVWVCSCGSVTCPGLLLIFATHFAIDRTQLISWWMGFNNQAGFRDNLKPWSSIVVDNVWHILILWIVIHAGWVR